MKGAKGILASLKLSKPLFHSSSQVAAAAAARSLHSQVTRITPLFHSSSSYLQNQLNNYEFLKPHQNFSTTPNSILQLITTDQNWSQELQSSPLTHETVVYVLKSLDKNPIMALDFFNWALSAQNKHGGFSFTPSLIVYDLMLTILANKETIKDFWALLRKMPSGDIEEGTYFTILRKLKTSEMTSDATSWEHFFVKNEKDVVAENIVGLDLMLGPDQEDYLAQKLEELEVVTLSEHTIVRILRAFREYPLKAFTFFRWLEEGKIGGYTHSAVTYNSILRVLCQEESIKEFWSVVKEMRDSGYDIDMDTYIKITRTFQKNVGMMEDAVKLYELMMDSPYKPSGVSGSSSILLRDISLNDNPDLDLTFRIVNKYEETGCKLSKIMYHGILRSLTNIGRCDEAEKILESMRTAGYEPDNFTYNQLLIGLCKARKLEEACKMLDEMEVQGCMPDIRAWTILIQEHCTAGEADRALKFCTKMLENNIEADADFLEVFVNGLCSNRRVDIANNLLTDMVETTNLRPSLATYKVLILKLLEERKFDEAMNLRALMKKHNFSPPREPFVDYISKFGTVDDAIRFLQALRVKDCTSFSVYFDFLRSLFKEARQSDARDLLAKCPDHIRKHPIILRLFTSQRPTSNTA